MRNYHLLIFSSYELILSFLFGLLTIFITLKVLNKLILKTSAASFVKEANVAMAIFQGTIVVCVLLLVQNSIMPAVDALRTMVMAGNKITSMMFLISFGYFLLFYSITLLFSLLMLFLAFKIYTKSTVTVDEVDEIKRNNVAVALVLGLTILGITLFIRPALDNFIASLVNHEMLELNANEEEKPAEGQMVVPRRRVQPN